MNWSSGLTKQQASTPGIEPGIFRSVGGRLIHWAMRNSAQEDCHVWCVSYLISSNHSLTEQDISSSLMKLPPVMHARHHSISTRKDITKEITFVNDRSSLSCHAGLSSSKRMT